MTTPTKTVEKVEPAHTPGEWSVHEPLGPGDFAVLSENVNAGGNFYVATLPNGQHAEARANAQLIAACPELLGACHIALAVFQGWKHDANPHNDLKRGESADYDAACRMAEMMEQAISKAKGHPTDKNAPNRTHGAGNTI